MKDRIIQCFLVLGVIHSGWSPTLVAQVFIPTQLERDWLNELIPGIVNGDGIMDTLHPGISAVDTASLMTNDADAMDLRGVGYLDALVDLSLSNLSLAANNFTQLDRVPASLLRLHIVSRASPIELPALPVLMDNLRILQQGLDEQQQGPEEQNAVVVIEQMPDTIGTVAFSDVEMVTWGGIPKINSFTWLNTESFGLYNYDNPFVAPACSTYYFGLGRDFNNFNAGIDLTEVHCLSMSLSAATVSADVIWPSMIEILNVSGVIIPFDHWPSSLRQLTLDVSTMTCLPPFPNSVSYLDLIDAASLVCLPNWPSALVPSNLYHPWPVGDVRICSVLNSDCPNAYPGVSGSLFIDNDADGVQDPGEPGVSTGSVQFQPGNVVLPCGADGSWEGGLPPGSYTITPSASYPYIQSYTPASHIASVPNMGDIDTDNHFAVTLIPNIQDLQTWLYVDPARPGFDNRLFLNYRNYGTMPVNSTLTLQWDADQQWVGSSVTPTSLSDNTATWDLGTLALAAEGLLTVDLSTLATVPLDTPIEHVLTVGPLPSDETPYNNVADYNDVVVGSYDPNEKLLRPAAMSPAQLLDPTARIEYTVRFQNTGSYLAERVVILDTLPEGLILESIQFLASSHPNSWYLTGGVLHVIHNDIMLPDSASDEPNSHGFIRFSIKPEPTLENGSTIANIAQIVFDFNAPIITPPAVFTVDVLASMNEVQRGTWSLWPNPTRDLLRLTVTDGALANQPCLVRDITGRTVMTSSTSASGDLPVGTLANGAYTMQVKGQAGVLRFVKE